MALAQVSLEDRYALERGRALMTGIQAVDRKLVEVGRVCQLGPLALVCRILVPAALPAWLTGVRGGLGLAWMFVIAAELMGASEGLGYLLLDGQMVGNADCRRTGFDLVGVGHKLILHLLLRSTIAYCEAASLRGRNPGLSRAIAKAAVEHSTPPQSFFTDLYDYFSLSWCRMAQRPA